MSALIAPILAILLSAAVATVGLWNLGDVSREGQADALAAGLVSEAKSVAAARTSRAREVGAEPGSVSDLRNAGYLSRFPADPVSDTSKSPDDLSLSADGHVELDISGKPAVCEAVNQLAGNPAAPASANANVNFGCTTSGTFFQKY